MAPQTRRLLLWLSPLVVVGACAAAVYGLYTRLPSFSPPPLPPLLVGARAGFGNWSGCEGGDGVSPDLEQRLREQFPPGSSDAPLVAALERQGFATPSFCGPYSTARYACYLGLKDSTTGKPIPNDVSACVYWKVDDANRIIWTHGYLHFLSL
jgi:hypothetical protein